MCMFFIVPLGILKSAKSSVPLIYFDFGKFEEKYVN